MSAQQLALRFISGKYQGGEFPLKMDREIIIGRSSDLDMVLVEDMVSRKHAKISTADEQVTIQDLGSTNGTFVNGEKVKQVSLREGDRILIGTSIIKLVSSNAEGASSFASMGEPPPSPSPKRTVTGARSMAGTIDEIPLPDLLQLLSTSKKSGVLEIETDTALGKIYMRKGQIYYASINDDAAIEPHKAIYRVMTWESGTFELQPADESTFDNELNEPTEGLLMEAMRQLDEINRLEDLPPLTAKIDLLKPVATKFSELKPEQLDRLQLILCSGGSTLQEIVDRSPGTDLDVYQGVAELIKANVLVVD